MIVTRAAFYIALAVAGSVVQPAWSAPGSNPKDKDKNIEVASNDCGPSAKSPSPSKPCKGNNGFGNGGGDGVPGNSGKTDTDR